ncbi:hypothetical protein [Actinoplanes sp. TFC3]|uniref:hypothetical protein n=1 Tax=Actinoplanes sp. TFC3 TaxID=1710355 RepID=UPI00191C1157|nr:hypothetical protein [Actinoplanes sp. TFC3]
MGEKLVMSPVKALGESVLLDMRLRARTAIREKAALVVLSGVQVGEPHWHRDQVSAVLAAGQFHHVPSCGPNRQAVRKIRCTDLAPIMRSRPRGGGSGVRFTNMSAAWALLNTGQHVRQVNKMEARLGAAQVEDHYNTGLRFIHRPAQRPCTPRTSRAR